MSETFSYDSLPYPSKFFLQTHPDRLATVATLFGMSPAEVETCRVLELGCGNGSNLISHAYHLPGATFIGVDLAQNHIDDARQGAAELGLTNLDFRRMDVADMSVAEFGRFDYIVAHGLFSWVPEFVRDRVLEICNEMLAENGVGYVSYNAFPGAHYRRMVQSMLRFQTRTVSDPIEKVGSAMSFLAFLCENASGGEVFRAILRHEMERHFEHEEADIFHDDLSDLNRAYYFHEFAGMLEKNGLQYLGEAEPHAMGTGGLSAEAREFVDSIADVIEREQHLDFLRGRIFRQTLFCRRSVKLARDLKPEMIREFMIASAVRPVSPNPELASSKVERFVGVKGIAIEIADPIAKAALVELGKAWGRALPFDDLMRRSRQELARRGYVGPAGGSEIDLCASLLTDLYRNTSLIELHLFQPGSRQELSERPRVNRLAQWQLPKANNVLTNLNLDVRIEDAVSRRLLELLDGSMKVDEIRPKLREFIATCEEIDDKAELLGRFDEWLDASLVQLAKLGMFDD